ARQAETLPQGVEQSGPGIRLERLFLAVDPQFQMDLAVELRIAVVLVLPIPSVLVFHLQLAFIALPGATGAGRIAEYDLIIYLSRTRRRLFLQTCARPPSTNSSMPEM